jgi:2'-5' RNA ligase
MRLFFALKPSTAALQNLRDVAEAVECGTSCRRVSPENYHVTLAFVGDVGVDALASIREIGTANLMSPGRVSLRSCEYWLPSRAVVAAGEASPSLSNLAASLQSAVAAHRTVGSAEPPWRPHVTLARKVLQAPVLQAMSPIEWNSNSFSLVSSERRDGQSIYTVVDTYPLLDKI